MIIGIDASNIRGGGGVTHLISLLEAAEPSAQGVDRVVVWGAEKTLVRIADRPWLVKRHDEALEAHAIRRAVWQRNRLPRLLAEEGCDLLFAPGGTVVTAYRPVVAMSQNLLPFEWRELRRYGLSLKTLRLLILRWSQGRSFQRADGVVFLTDYASSAVQKVTGAIGGKTAVIPHGVDDRFRGPRTAARDETNRPMKLLYVSPFEPYKHQEKVARAVAELRNKGSDLEIAFVGSRGRSFSGFETERRRIDEDGEFIEVVGSVPYDEMPGVYEKADVFVFASSCENLPNILLEAMASELPVVSSERGPMREVLGEAGVYFDPEDAASIAGAIDTMLSSAKLRAEMARNARRRAAEFAWRRCADETFAFLADVARSPGRPA